MLPACQHQRKRRRPATGSPLGRGRLDRLPPQSFFLVSAVFHCLGPSLAVLLAGALPAFGHPGLLLAGIGVGVCSSVIPYVTDQLAMARMTRASFALMLALLPVSATVVGAVVLRQFPTAQDIAGIVLVTIGVAVHQEKPAVAGLATRPDVRAGS
jgi:threonine/homoserine efflux transporter RhtA